jgi:hypothetical protein
MMDKEPGLAAVLFPHVAISDRDLRRALALFDRIIVCRPWLLDPAHSPLETPPSVDIRHPPEALRPPPDFIRILSEHRRWMDDHQDIGLTSFLAAFKNGFEDSESTWQIRKGIRTGGGSSTPTREEKAMEWHLLLHLSYELEQARLETDEALRRITRLESPLKEALGEDADAPGLLDDLHGVRSRFATEEAQLLQITNAWLGLFGEHLDRSTFALTFAPEVAALGIEGAGDMAEAHFRFPDPSYPDPEGSAAARPRLGKDARQCLSAFSAALRTSPAPGPEEIREICRDLESRLSFKEANVKDLAVSLWTFHPHGTGKEDAPAGSLARRLAGKGLVLIEEADDAG